MLSQFFLQFQYLLFALFVPHGFIWSLRYAGAFVALINLLLPVLLWLKARQNRLVSTTLSPYVFLPLMVYIVIFSGAVLWIDFMMHIV